MNGNTKFENISDFIILNDPNIKKLLSFLECIAAFYYKKCSLEYFSLSIDYHFTMTHPVHTNTYMHSDGGIILFLPHIILRCLFSRTKFAFAFQNDEIPSRCSVKVFCKDMYGAYCNGYRLELWIRGHSQTTLTMF